jgi:ribose 5-phosphate isomerase B
MRSAIASDHAGYAHKTLIIAELKRLGHQVKDFGTDSDAAVDYPLYIRPAAEAVASGECERAIVLGGSGNGENIVANRVPGVRCAYCFSVQTAMLGRQHNDANCIAIGQRLVDGETALAIVRTFLETSFEGGRHVRRIQLIDQPKTKA